MIPTRSEKVSFAELQDLVPTAPGWRSDWDRIWPLWPDLSLLDSCPQDPSIMRKETSVAIRAWSWRRWCQWKPGGN